jgi:predicted nucleic acid-binding protein
MVKQIVLDANILIRAVLGKQAEPLLQRYADEVVFLTLEKAFKDAERYIPNVIKKRGGHDETAKTSLVKLANLRSFVQVVPVATIQHLESMAKKRLARRDKEDWPYLALALLLKCPIWTEDTDFFGCGVAVWTSDRINLFLEEDDSLGL